MSAWADGLLRNSLQGGLAILIIFALFQLFPRIPGAAQVWMWRAIALKFILGMILPVTIFTKTWKASGVLPSDPLPAVILFCSLTGLFLAIGVTLRDWATVRKLRKGGIPVELGEVDQLAERLRLKRKPVVLLRSDIDRPLLSGAGNPTIHLPEGLDDKSVKMVLAHELSHIKRCDLAWEWLFVAAEAIFFFHPLVWLMRREHRIAQENACDAMALQATRSSLATYGRMLLELTVSHKKRELALTANMAGTYAALRSRIVKLHRGHVKVTPITALTLLLTAMALLPTWRSEYRAEVRPRATVTNSAWGVAAPIERFDLAPKGRVRTPKEGRP